MSQMYQVTYIVHGEGAETGRAIVCAQNSDQAAEMVMAILKLPASRVRFESARVKPSFYQIDRREMPAARKDKPQKNNDGATASVFELSASCQVKAYSEASAWRKFGDGLIARASANAPFGFGGILDIQMSADRSELRCKESAVDQQAIYSKHRFFSGGAARPK
jgi:uncharacterized protein YsxB (DUF464 family)